MKITLKDGSVKEFNDGLSVYEIAKGISEGLARATVGAKVNGKVVETRTVLNEDCKLELLTFADDEGKLIYRHTASHILAQAVKNIFPTVKLAIGPAIANGFYYDFDFKTPISTDEFNKIEQEMKNIIKANYPITRFVLPKKEAIELMKGYGEDYKVELINDLPEGEEISFYKQGEFVDLCAGPHLPFTGMVKAFKLTSLTGAYWRGNEKNKMLSRIYGTAFDKKSELQAYLEAVEEAKKRDHNKLGREMGIFMTDENIGQGLPLLMPKGAKLFQILQRFVEDEEEKRGYVLTKTPYMAKSNLYKISGHWDHYKDGMFVIGDEEKEDEEVFALRPMTCPFQYTIYNNGLKSYRDLPIRYGETSTLFRNEASGEMHGLIRVRQFTLSEGHIVCTPSQLESEFSGVVDLVKYMMRCMGLEDDVTYRFSKWDPDNTDKYINEPEVWEKAESTMRRILDNIGIDYVEAKGEAAFYGPKLDIQIKNVYGKEDTIITVQVDMFLAENFDMSYIDENGEKQRPYIIHRSSIGSYERTMALLIEKYGGAFPVWASPVQVKVISLTDRTVDACNKINDKLKAMGIRAEVDSRSETVGYKIRAAQLEKIPYMLIIGDKEVENDVVAVRRRGGVVMGEMKLMEFAEKVLDDVATKRLD
ncbi:MAG: threonine--tRNA ligase [Clostridia bacterium]|nr:threonine--tRNA ligase [Clostridia bacterium]MDE7328771.1 threonine--tRNA ligase [Clostridia bacterium]